MFWSVLAQWVYSTTLHALNLLANGIAWCSFVRNLCLKPGMWLVGWSGIHREYSSKWRFQIRDKDTCWSISVWRLSFSGSGVTSCMFVCYVVCCFQTWYPRSIITSTSNLVTTRTPKLSPLRLWVSMAPSMADPLDMLLQVGCYSDTRCYACQTEKSILTHNEGRFKCQTLLFPRKM